jgi:hypothetical protein
MLPYRPQCGNDGLDPPFQTGYHECRSSGRGLIETTLQLARDKLATSSQQARGSYELEKCAGHEFWVRANKYARCDLAILRCFKIRSQYEVVARSSRGRRIYELNKRTG